MESFAFDFNQMEVMKQDNGIRYDFKFFLVVSFKVLGSSNILRVILISNREEDETEI